MSNLMQEAGPMRETVTGNPVRAFHVMTKPIGPICNLDCKYCFYLEKEKLFPFNENFKMSDEVLETYVRQYIEVRASRRSLSLGRAGNRRCSG